MNTAAKESKTSLATKKHLSECLKELMKEQKFNKITISALVEKAGVNRKTFYYHFKSTAELLAWTFEQEAFGMVENFDFVDDYDAAISFVMDYVEQNRDLIKAAASSIGRGEIRRFLYNDLYRVVLKHTKKTIPDEPEDYQKVVAEFYAEAFAGVLLRWTETPAEHSLSREQVTDYFKRLFSPFLQEQAAKK